MIYVFLPFHSTSSSEPRHAFDDRLGSFQSMSSSLSAPLSHRRIAPLPVRPRSSSGQSGRSQNMIDPHSLSSKSSIETGQCSSISCASHRRHSYHHPDATADARHFPSPAAGPTKEILQFGQTGSNSQPGEQHGTSTYRVLHNVTPRPSPRPEEMRLSSPQNPRTGLSSSSLPILSTPEQAYLQPLPTLYSDEKIAIDGGNSTLEPVNASRIALSSGVTAGVGIASPSRSVPSLSFTQKSALSPSPSLHGGRISDASVISVKDDACAPYDVQDEKAPAGPFFTPAFQTALQRGLDIAKSTVAAIERLGGRSEPGGDLNRLMKDATDLSTFQSSDTRTIAVLGDSGEGKHGCCQRRGVLANCLQGRAVLSALSSISQR